MRVTISLCVTLCVTGCRGWDAGLDPDTGLVTSSCDAVAVPDPLDFEIVFIGESASSDLHVVNIGDGACELSGLKVGGVDAHAFQMATLLGAIPAGTQISFDQAADFRPLREGEHHAYVELFLEPGLSLFLDLYGIGVWSDKDGDGFASEDGDCDDEQPAVWPGAEDICDGLDNNCDGTIDEPFAVPDLDRDGVCEDDNCPNQVNADQLDSDGDDVGDVCDPCPFIGDVDLDGDGRCDNTDNCPQSYNADQLDSDGDGWGDACDPFDDDPEDDVDGDHWGASVDNCPSMANPAQSDGDDDGWGDVCDVCPFDALNDIDEDGRCGDQDNCPFVANSGQENHDGDAQGDVCDACPTVGQSGLDPQQPCPEEHPDFGSGTARPAALACSAVGASPLAPWSGWFLVLFVLRRRAQR